MNFEVRQLLEQDTSLLMATPVGVFDDMLIPSSWERFLSSGNHLLVGAIAGGNIIGFVSGVSYDHPDKAQPVLWINEVGVSEGWQQKGVGKALMLETFALAKRMGCSSCWVLTDGENEAANALYRSAGGHASPTVMYDFDV